MLSNIVTQVSDFISGLSNSQIVALMVLLICIWLVADVAKKGLSIACSAIALLAALYFIAPGMYAAAIAWLHSVVQAIF